VGAPATATEPASAPLPDRALRQRLFYSLLLLTLAAVWASHRLETVYAYELNATDPVSGELQSRTLQHGSFGAYLADPEPAAAHLTRHPVVLLGNSIYHACGIAARMQRMANADGDGIEFVNLAQTGSGIHDYFAQMIKSLRFRPQLLVVTFINLAFTPDFAGTKLPRFRTDADQMLFDRDVIGDVPVSFLHRELTFAEATDSFVSSLFPFKRLDLIVHFDVDFWLYRRCLDLGIDPVMLRVLFPLPTINLTQDWLGRPIAHPVGNADAQPYPDLQAIVTEFLGVCRAHDIPVLFVRQESSETLRPDVVPELRRICAAFPRVQVVDLQPLFRPEDYVDQVHPAETERDAYAKRHYEVIRRAYRALATPAKAGAGK
jgi:hypothetical protein